MLLIYLFMILLAAFPLTLTVWRMRRSSYIRKNGIHVNGTIAHIRRIRIKTGYIDFLTIHYQDRATGTSYQARATSRSGKYRYQDRMEIVYLPQHPAKYAVPDAGKGYTAVLIFCILLFLFVLFAVYKIHEAVQSGAM